MLHAIAILISSPAAPSLCPCRLMHPVLTARCCPPSHLAPAGSQPGTSLVTLDQEVHPKKLPPFFHNAFRAMAGLQVWWVGTRWLHLWLWLCGRVD